MKTEQQIQNKVRGAVSAADHKYGPTPNNTDDEWLRIIIEEIQETAQHIDKAGVSHETDSKLEAELAQVIATATRWLTHRRPNVPEKPQTPPPGWADPAQDAKLNQAAGLTSALTADIPHGHCPNPHLATNPHTQAHICAAQAHRLLTAAQQITSAQEPMPPAHWHQLHRLRDLTPS